MGAWAQPFALKSLWEPWLNRSFLNKNESLGSTVCLKETREPGLNCVPVVDFSNYMNHAYKLSITRGLSCLLYPCEHGSLVIDRSGGWTWVRSPRWKGMGTLHSTFSDKYGGIDPGLHHHNLVNALTLYTPVRVTVSFKCHDARPKFVNQAKSKIHE